MLTTKILFRLRLFFCVIASVLNTTFAVLLSRQTVAHSDICWWLFSLETIGLVYYVIVEFWMNRFYEGRLSLLGIIGSAVATQGVLSNSLDSPLSRILQLLVGCNLGFIFTIGLRIRSADANNNGSAVSIAEKQAVAGTQVGEIQHETMPFEDKMDWDSQSEASSDDRSVDNFEETGYAEMRDFVSLGMGICGLLIGISGWVINFSAWIKECLDKDTCSELGPQWWTLGQSLLFFTMYVLAMTFSRSFEIIAPYSVLVSIPSSIFLRVANTARSDVFYLKNQENAYETWDSIGTVIGSSLLAIAGAFLVLSLGILNFSWKSPAPENLRSFRATLSLSGLIGVVIFGIGLHSVQNDVCAEHDPLCNWYDGLWVEITLEILIVLFGILSVFGQPGESVRAMLIALTVLPSFTYIINVTRFLDLWNSVYYSSTPLWEIRFSASGLLILLIVNYLWILAWGWGKTECVNSRTNWLSCESGITKTLLQQVKSFTIKSRRSAQTHDVADELEMGRVDGHISL